MPDKDIHFCKKCRDQLKSEILCLLWESICEKYISTGEWMPFSEVLIRKNAEVRKLEQKGYLTSIDHENQIFLRAEGVFECDYDKKDAYFLVCINLKEHMDFEQCVN